MDIDIPQFFKILSDPTRLRCLSLLESEGELCVCELTHALKLAQPKISHHLAALRKLGLVSDRRDGLWIYYRINKELPQWAAQVIQITMTGINEQQPYADDLQALKQMANRPAGFCKA